MKVFVTGATGFIGRRLVERLLRDGADVTALVRNDNHGLPADVRIARGDVTRPESLGGAGAGCERLYHLAAMITFDPSSRAELLNVNAAGAANIIAAARRWNVPRSVVASSACTVGLSYSEKNILDEDSPLDAELPKGNPYMESKLETEKIAFSAVSSGQHVVIVNPTTVYGPGDRTFNSGTLVKKIASAIFMPVPPGGGNVVDVDDAAEGIIAAGERGTSGRRYILGGQNLKFAEIFSTIARVTEHHPLMIPIPAIMRGPAALAAGLAGRMTGGRFLTPQIVGDLFAYKYYSSARAEREIGWRPLFSFRESMARAWAYYKQENLI